MIMTESKDWQKAGRFEGEMSGGRESSVCLMEREIKAREGGQM
jgi:hypothetical protein